MYMWKGPHTRVQKKHIMLSVMCVLVFAFLILLLFSFIIRMNHPRTRKNNRTATQLLQTLLSFLVCPHQCPLGRHCSKQTTEAQEYQQVVQARAMYQERKTTIDQCLRASSAEVGAYIKRHLEYAGADHDIFSDNAIDEIFKFSGGAARMVNKVCTHCLLYGRRTIGELLMITWSSWSFRESWFSSPCPYGQLLDAISVNFWTTNAVYCWILWASSNSQVAWAAVRTRKSSFHDWFWTHQGKLGRKKAIIAVARKILVLIYKLLKSGEFYDPMVAKVPVQSPR